METHCAKCRRPFEEQDRVAAISGSIMGDEHTDCFYLCATCNAYTIQKWRDNFTGEETASMEGPVDKRAGDRLVTLIGKCERPWDKKCRCAAHRAYFNDILD